MSSDHDGPALRETAEGFWARLDGRRFHWFRGIERLSACGNRYAATTVGAFADGAPPLMLQCARCAERARRVIRSQAPV